jgi:hypothetical protein
MPQSTSSQSLFLVLGGELERLDSAVFRDPGTVDVVGVFSDKESAAAAWKSKAQGSVDNAHMRYFIIDITPSFTQAAKS